MDYRDNRQRWAESHQVVHFYAGQWCTFTPALTVTRDWMNSPNRPNLGNDLLVGRSFGGGGRMTINRAGDGVTVRTGDNRWVIPTGGAYLFVPSLASLSGLATG